MHLKTTTRPKAIIYDGDGMGWDKLSGTGVATALKIVQRLRCREGLFQTMKLSNCKYELIFNTMQCVIWIMDVKW